MFICVLFFCTNARLLVSHLNFSEIPVILSVMIISILDFNKGNNHYYSSCFSLFKSFIFILIRAFIFVFFNLPRPHALFSILSQLSSCLSVVSRKILANQFPSQLRAKEGPSPHISHTKNPKCFGYVTSQKAVLNSRAVSHVTLIQNLIITHR